MAIFEGFVLASTDWNDRTNFIMQDFDPGIAPKRFQWISGADSDGALPVEEADYDNAEMTVRLRIAPQANMDAALAKIGTLVLALQECEKQALGSAAVWTPAGSTKSLTAYIVGGEVTGIPLSLTGDDAGWFLRNPAPVVTMKLYRRPFLYGPEVTSAATVTNSLPYQVLTVASVTGDVPAEARLVVTDAATKDRRHFEWGLRQRYYDAATSLYIDSDNMVTSGFGGTGTTRTGADDPGASGNTVIRGTLTTSAQAICGLGNLGHVGSYRLKLRVYSAQVSTSLDPSTVKVRLSWKEGDGPLRSNDWTSPVLQGGFAEVDLGLINIPEKTLGTQRWTGQIEAYTTGTAGDTLDVDYGLLFPTDAYGKARVPPDLVTPTAFSARDEFDQTAGNLTAKTAPVGGNWATAGAATDFAVDATNHWITRSADDTDPGRAAWLPVSLTNTISQVDFKYTDDAGVNNPGFPAPFIMGRYIDESNYVAGIISFGASGRTTSAVIRVRVAAVNTTIAINPTYATTVGYGSWTTMRLMVDTSGVVSLWHALPGGSLQRILIATHSALATGGALASGFPGIRDNHAVLNTVTRFYDNFWAAAYTPDAVVYSTRSAEFNSTKAERADSTGTYYGPVSNYRGARFYLPPAGSAARTSQILTKTRRNDIDTMTDDQIADSTTVTVHYTPRYYTAPR